MILKQGSTISLKRLEITTYMYLWNDRSLLVKVLSRCPLSPVFIERPIHIVIEIFIEGHVSWVSKVVISNLLRDIVLPCFSIIFDICFNI